MALSDDYLWWRDGVIYQIYPRSFADSNGDGLGDLPGITSHLAYLASLGIDAIWLSPFYPSPDRDFGYDVSDHCAVDPRYGTLADFDHLLAEAHRHGLRVIVDLVLNHTSDQHPWFRASRSGRDNPYREWYIWRDPSPRAGAPNNWMSRFIGPAWTYDQITGQYYLHIFLKEQPDVNWRNPAVRQAQLDVVRFWLERGVDGFRLDAFNAYFKHPELRDNPPRFAIGRASDRQHHIYDTDQPEMLALLGELRSLLNRYPDRYAVGETFLSTAEKAALYSGDAFLPAAFNFEFSRAAWYPAAFLRAIRHFENALGPDRWPNYVLSNHDIVRSASRYAHGEDDARVKVSLALLLTLRGTPFLYQGEEIGMRDITLRRDQVLDPPGKYYWPFYKGRDGCRAPMQWDGSPQAGFTSGAPWLPVHPNYLLRNVAAQTADPQSVLSFTRALTGLRRRSAALQRGGFTALTGDRDLVLAYLREHEGQRVIVALNFSRRPQDLRLNRDFGGQLWRVLLSSTPGAPTALAPDGLTLEGGQALLLGQET